jgi:KaiC/GvpD/RAD55 family RecA-like ATPase
MSCETQYWINALPMPQELCAWIERTSDAVKPQIAAGDVWLWPGRLPLGKALVISGAPGTNKSMLSLALVTCVTNGWNWPDGGANTMGPQDVLIAATEDDLETTINARLMAMGADMGRITAIKNVVNLDENGKKKSRELNLEADTNNLFQLLRANPRIRMVVLDPLTGFYGGTDGNDNKKIRPMLQRIAKVCHLTGAAFILLIHENKRSEANATDRMLGAGAVSQVVRAGIRISKDPKNKPDGRIMANIKTSQSRDNGGMKFSVASKDVECESGLLKDIGYIEWGEKHGMSADDVLDEERAVKKEGGTDTKLGQAVQIFVEALKDGPKLHRAVHPLLDAANISDETKRRARWKAGVQSSKRSSNKKLKMWT